MDAYSALKAAWHTRDIETLRAGGSIVPKHLYLILSDLCNQDCSFCTYRSADGWANENFGADTGKGFTMNPNRMMATGKALEIIGDAAKLGVKAIQFTGGGEPTLHPNIGLVIETALDHGLQAGLITNGTKLPRLSTMKRLSWIRVSVDAGFEDTYEATRKSKLWPRVIENLATLAALEGPRLGVSFVVTRENYQEILPFCDLMWSLKVPYVKISANLTKQGLAYYDGILDAIMADVARLSSIPGFTIVNAFARRLEDLKLGAPVHAFCGQQRFAGYIGADLKVYRCCNTAYTSRGEIGDLREMTYAQWFWLHSNEAFEGFDARGCEHCQFHDKNEAIAYLVQPRPEHVEFI